MTSIYLSNDRFYVCVLYRAFSPSKPFFFVVVPPAEFDAVFIVELSYVVPGTINVRSVWECFNSSGKYMSQVLCIASINSSCA